MKREISAFVVLSALVLMPAQFAPSGHTEPIKTAPGTKTLKGKFNLLDAEFEQAGIKLDDDQLPSTISVVKDGSAADAANIGRSLPQWTSSI